MTIEIVDLGDWGAATLVSEYDPHGDTIRINARAIAVVRGALGDAEARCFTAVAIAHERFHRAYPDASEVQALAAAREATGVDPARFEALLAR